MIEAKEVAEIAKKRAEVSKDLEKAKRKLEHEEGILEGRIRRGQGVGTKHIDVKYAANEVERVNRKLDNLK